MTAIGRIINQSASTENTSWLRINKNAISLGFKSEWRRQPANLLQYLGPIGKRELSNTTCSTVRGLGDGREMRGVATHKHGACAYSATEEASSYTLRA